MLCIFTSLSTFPLLSRVPLALFPLRRRQCGCAHLNPGLLFFNTAGWLLMGCSGSECVSSGNHRAGTALALGAGSHGSLIRSKLSLWSCHESFLFEELNNVRLNQACLKGHGVSTVCLPLSDHWFCRANHRNCAQSGQVKTISALWPKIQTKFQDSHGGSRQCWFHDASFDKNWICLWVLLSLAVWQWYQETVEKKEYICPLRKIINCSKLALFKIMAAIKIFSYVFLFTPWASVTSYKWVCIVAKKCHC